ncbi:MAG: ABC transporter substrate-binding protein [Calditrichaeota bacterium]|nr:MAG: ABC transporter substrate-binding protein [Calditrichota bacterium]
MLQIGLQATVEDSPVAVIRHRNETIQKILKQAGDKVDDATRERLKDIINNIIDFKELARLALGKYWKERTEKEKAEFVDVFRKLIRNSSVKKLEIYRADRIEYKPAVIKGDKATVTTIAYKGRKSVEIVYKMHKVNGQWKVYDMVIDGLSTARSYRDSFYKQIAKSSYQEMYNKLVKRLEEQT